MTDFTSSLYLGFTHPHENLPAWSRLTSGRPAVLGETAAASRVERAGAALLGVDDVVLSRSTLHASWDVVDELARGDVCFLVDDGAYAVLRWALEHATAVGVPVRSFRHHDLQQLDGLLTARELRGRLPVVVTDGLCPGCGPTPLADFVERVAPDGGLVLVDDTQAVGVLGERPGPDAPYGHLGGGTLRWTGADPAHVVVVASLAKGFGAPLAVTAGPRTLMHRLRVDSPTRVHTSPPTAADVAAAELALRGNATLGERRRQRLARLVDRLRAGLRRLGVAARRDHFPVQPAGPFPTVVARRVHESVARDGVGTALQRPRCGEGALVTFVVNATHRSVEIDHALVALERALHDHGVLRHAS